MVLQPVRGRLLTLAAFASSIGALAACHDAARPTDPALVGSVDIRTDAPAYAWAHTPGVYESRVIVRTRALGRDTLFLAGCAIGEPPANPVIRRAGGDAARVFIQLPLRNCGSPPMAITLVPGEVRQDTLTLYSSESPAASPPITAEARVGRFVLKYLVTARTLPDGRLDLSSILRDTGESNAFELRYP